MSSGDATDEYAYWFDPDTAQLVLFAYSYEGNPGGLRFRKAFNYRRVGGILFFDQENLGVDIEGLSVDQIDERFVSERLRQISTVTLQNFQVRPLEAKE